MVNATALARLLPTGVTGRLLTTFAEIVLAAAVLSGAVVVGHDLREWRAWYWDPATIHPWAPTPAPSASPVAEPR